MILGDKLLRTRICACTFYCIAGLVFASWASRIPDVKQMLSLSDGDLGLALLAIPVGQLTMMAFSGYLVTEFGSRITLYISTLAYILVLNCIPFISAMNGLVCNLFFFGAAANLLNIALNTQACAIEDEYKKNIMSSFHGVWSLGGVIGGLIGMYFARTDFSISTHYLFVALIGIGLSSLCHTYLLSDKAVGDNFQNGKNFSISNLNKTIFLLGFIAFGGMFCEGTLFDWSSVYFATVVRPDDNLIRLGYVAGLGTMTIGRFCADRLVYRFHASTVLRVSGIIITVGLSLATLFPDIVTATAGFMLVGIGISSIVPICYSIAGHQEKIPAGIAITAVSSISFIGFMIGPPVIGFISEWINLRIALAMASLLGFMIVTLSAKLQPQPRVAA